MYFECGEDSWKCPNCGSSRVKLHCQEFAGKREQWTTRKERENDPELAKKVEDTKIYPLVAIHDLT